MMWEVPPLPPALRLAFRVRDFGARLRRRASASSSSPFDGTSFSGNEVPFDKLRAGFRCARDAFGKLSISACGSNAARALRGLIAKDAVHRALYEVFLEARDAAAKILENTTVADLVKGRAPGTKGKREQGGKSRSGAVRKGAN